MNKIFKVIYSKTKHMYVVASELAKSHSRSKSEGATFGKALAALVMAALASVSFMAAPMTAQAKTETEGWEYIGIKHDSSDSSSAENYKGAGSIGDNSITIGENAKAGEGTIAIGDRRADVSKASVYVGQGDIAKPKTDTGAWVTSVGYNSDATGYGSIAIGSNAVAKNSYDKDASGNNIQYSTTYKDTSGKSHVILNANPGIQRASVALGYGASADNGNIAIGSYSDASTDLRTNATKAYKTETTADSYVSVGSSSALRRVSNVADGAADTDVATIAQLKKVADTKAGSWTLTAGKANSSTVTAGSTVDFSAATDSKDSTGTDHSNLSVSKTTDSNNVTIGLNKDVILGQATSGNGGSLSVYAAPGTDQLGSHVLLDGNTVSVRYKKSGDDSERRGVVLGVTEDADSDNYGYISFDNGNFYLHGASTEDGKDKAERLVYNTDGQKKYIANLDDGLKVTGDTAGTTVTTSLNPEAKNNTLSITGGETDSSKLTTGNIGVVATAATDTAGGNLNIRLAKDLTGITSISNQTTSGTTTTGGKIELGANGTTISGGDVKVSGNKITGLKDGTETTDAATVGQMNTAIGNAKTKYYSVHEGPQIAGFSTNEKNDGASAWAGLAAGYETGTAGIGSTVVGSYSGVMNEGTGAVIDLRGAASLSLGTLNLNQSTNATVTGNNTKPYSGVANSIVGQGNMTTDSNAALIFGAGNTVSNSYRDVQIDTSTMKGSTPSDLETALQTAVPKSGAQVMVMGGGNNITSAYMTQVIGVGNTVTGGDTTYAEGTSTQYNYVDGSNNTLTNGKNDYIIGANNSVTGDSIDKNQSNIVVGDNHTLTDQKNNVVIGSADSQKELKASDAVVIGHNADVSVDGGVAIGSGSVSAATAKADVEGYDPVSTAKNKASTDTSATWKATTGAVSIGANGTTTRRITNLAAGFNDTDAVNVAQIKNLANVDASNVGWYMKNTDRDAKRANAVAWAKAIGRGKVANPTADDKATNGSDQLVTGGTVYEELKKGLGINNDLVNTHNTTAVNLKNLANNTVVYKYNGNGVGSSGEINTNYDEIQLEGYHPYADGSNFGTAITNLRSALEDKEDNPLKDANGNVITLATATGDDLLRHAVNLGDLQDAYNLDAHVDASNIGANLQYKADGSAVTDGDKITNENNWGTAIGTGKIADAKASDASTNGSQQLVTGGTVYSEVRPTTDGTYVKTAQTTAQNLTSLDTQVKKNADDLSKIDDSSVKYDTNGTTVDKTKITLAGKGGTTITNVKAGALSENSTDAVNGAQLYAEQQARDKAISNAKTKYYSVHEGPQIAGFSTNESNDGASNWAGLAAGYETGTAGIGSTVVGSYSGVMNTGTVSGVDLRGAASLSMGTLNLNQNNDTSKKYSGVANSIVGQGNMTTNSNAAIILGAGNTITDSYKDVNIDTSAMKGSTPEALEEALQKAVPESGGQVMAIGGGNKISKASKTQVVGLGNTVSGTELNYVEGFNNTVTGGTSNYLIGAQNTLTGGSKNIVVGDKELCIIKLFI